MILRDYDNDAGQFLVFDWNLGALNLNTQHSIFYLIQSTILQQ